VNSKVQTLQAEAANLRKQLAQVLKAYTFHLWITCFQALTLIAEAQSDRDQAVQLATEADSRCAFAMQDNEKQAAALRATRAFNSAHRSNARNATRKLITAQRRGTKAKEAQAALEVGRHTLDLLD
jgi:hypothetical protein